MFKSYFKTAWRNLFRNKVLSVINVTGLALGMAGAVLLIMFAGHDYAFKFQQAKNMAILINCFAFIAVFISCMGLFGLSTYMAENRLKGIGIRKVLGND